MVRPVTSAIICPQKPERAPPPTSNGVTGAAPASRKHVDAVGERERDAFHHRKQQRLRRRARR